MSSVLLTPRLRHGKCPRFLGKGQAPFIRVVIRKASRRFSIARMQGSWGGLAPLAFLRAQMSLSLLLGCNRSGSGRRQCRPAKAFGKFSRAASCPENSLRCAKPRALQPFLINRGASALLHCNYDVVFSPFVCCGYRYGNAFAVYCYRSSKCCRLVVYGNRTQSSLQRLSSGGFENCVAPFL